MGILNKLFKPKQDPLYVRAINLVPSARINATSIFVPLLDKYSFLKDVNVKNFDFIVTVAGVFIASSRLNNLSVSEAKKEQVMHIVAQKLEEWSHDGIRAFEDCKGFYETEYDRLEELKHESRFLSTDAIGIWIVWNILGNAPQDEAEIRLIRNMGINVIEAFFEWWEI